MKAEDKKIAVIGIGGVGGYIAAMLAKAYPHVTMVAVENEGRVYTPDMVLGPPRKGIKLTYTTDTRPTESILRNAKDSDLFICEGMYGEDDKIEKAKGYKHMTFREAATLAREAEVGEMWLTHYSPSLVRPDDYLDTVREIFPKAWPGKDGKSVELNFEED